MRACATSVVLAVCCAPALGQFVSGFEAPTYNGSPAGTPISGQDGWYLPAVAGSVDGLVFTYEANALGITPLPGGDAQFEAGVSGGGTAFARAQRDIDFSVGGDWTVTFDLAVTFGGPLPSAPNLGSFSLQPSTTSTFWQTLYNWVDVNTCTEWNLAFMPFDSFGVQAAQPGLLPDPAFGNLAPNHWYRLSVSWSFTSNQITSISITDLVSGATTTVTPVDWYLSGGASPVNPLPTSIRHFVGGGAGNTVAVDNFSISGGGGPNPCDPDFNQDGNSDQDDVQYLTNVVAGGENPTGRDPDFNQDGNVDQDDVQALINVVAGGECP
ncbi:MAG: hypothetical protein DYG92_03150 [Leptolyngbya sp. PLA1]|nr:hypothetical protein [Leptolyngbya sp. PLA1]